MAAETDSPTIETPARDALLLRIDAALDRAEQAAALLDARVRSVSAAARQAVAGLDRLIATEEDKLRG